MTDQISLTNNKCIIIIIITFQKYKFWVFMLKIFLNNPKKCGGCLCFILAQSVNVSPIAL